MKKKKLILKKDAIVNLNNEEMSELKGGATQNQICFNTDLCQNTGTGLTGECYSPTGNPQTQNKDQPCCQAPTLTGPDSVVRCETDKYCTVLSVKQC